MINDPMIPPIPVVCAVIIHDGLVLAARRGPARDQAGKWEFPGGKVQPGETESDALIREIREELGIEVVPGRRLEPVVFHYPGKSIELIPYLCPVRTPHVALTEHAACRWCLPQELAALDWAAADRPVAAAVREYLEEGG